MFNKEHSIQGILDLLRFIQTNGLMFGHKGTFEADINNHRVLLTPNALYCERCFWDLRTGETNDPDFFKSLSADVKN